MSWKNTALVALLAACALPALADKEGWVTDFEAAKQQAAEEGKHLLLDFTGSDWCGWCIKLDEEVFSQAAFKEAAPEKFILVELDFPNSIPQPDELKAQNAELAKTYGVQGYPTIILLDSEGELYGQTGYRDGGAEAYLAHLDELRGNGMAMAECRAEAEALEGSEKAVALDKLADMRATNGLPVGDIADQIIELDADNAAGLRNKHLVGKKLDMVPDLANGGDMAGAMVAVDEALALEPTGESLQLALFYKGLLHLNNEEREEGKAQLEKARDVDAESDLGKRCASILEQVAAEDAQGE